MKLFQGMVVELPFMLPQGIVPHPGIIISSNDFIELENHQLFFAVMLTHDKTDDEATFKVINEMFDGDITSYQARMHIISSFRQQDIMRNSHRTCKMRNEYLTKLKKNIAMLILK